MIHFGTPCSSWSISRTTGSNTSSTVVSGRVCAKVTVELMKLARRYGIYISIENPKSSKLWDWGPLKEELKRSRCEFIEVNMCAWGTPYLKPTYFCSNLPGLREQIGQLCTYTCRHIQLQGVVRMGVVVRCAVLRRAAPGRAALCRGAV